jgi:hypothetical protein
MKEPKVHPNDEDPERALIAERRRLAVAEGEVNRVQRDIDSLKLSQTGYLNRARLIKMEIARLEKLIRKKEKP